MTKASKVSKEAYNNFSEHQKELYMKSHTFTDKINLYHINLIAKLLKEGKYPNIKIFMGKRGASPRIYTDKPGQPEGFFKLLQRKNSPRFMDWIVQKAMGSSNNLRSCF